MPRDSIPTIRLSPGIERSDAEPFVVDSPRNSQRHALDWLLIIAVCALAFLLAATPARNSDLWLNLASGRSLINGASTWGTDPFASTTNGVFWVNHTWLSDVLLFELHRIDGGRALVIAKGVLILAIAALLFWFRRSGASMALPACAATLAIVAFGPWMLLQPVLFSVVGLVLTLWLLERPNFVDSSRLEKARRMRWLLLPLFVIWANLDGWYLLGPVLVGLYTVREGVHVLCGRGPASRRELGTLGLLTALGFAVCLLTPYHYRIFAWPTPLGLTQAEQAWMRDPAGRNLVIAPFSKSIVKSPAFSGPGGWAYCILLVLGGASFFLCPRNLHLGRLFVWLGLAALSIYQARTIPFFAVATAPVLVLNFDDWARRRLIAGLGNQSRPYCISKFAIVMSRMGLLLAGTALLVLAWPGWLQSPPYQPRRWSIEPDESLVRLAARLQTMHWENPSQNMHRGLNFSPEAAHYLAWYFPTEKGFFDSRWALFDGVAKDYVGMRKGLLAAEPNSSSNEWNHRLSEQQIDHIVLYDTDGERVARALRNLIRDE